MKAYVLAKKGILINSSDAQRMTPTQWAFEYISLKKNERNLFDIYFKAMKQLLVNTMGLNALRPTDINGIPKDIENMTPEEKENYLPLIAWVGNPHMLKTVADQYDVATITTSDPNTSKDYEDLVLAIDQAGGDMEAVLNLPDTKNIGSKLDPLYAEQFRQMVKNSDDMQNGDNLINEIKVQVSKV